nr:cell division protein ZipA C-terminal FtsZ-binding domain-containing protein [uncultured Halomonas sp.]
MDYTSLAIVLASLSLLLGVIAAFIFVYIIMPKRRRAKAKAATPPTPPVTKTSSTPAPPTEAPNASASKTSSKTKQHALFVIFAHPDMTTDERLTEWLRGKSAHYDALKKVFLIDGQQPSNPITVANAFPPGEMPDLLRGETHKPIQGISLLVKPPLRKRRNQQMHVYVELAKEMQALFSGEMLDAEREPATDVTYQRIIG